MAHKLEPIIVLLTALLLFLIVCLFASEVFFKEDTQFFQVISNMASGVLGALLGIITGRGKSQDVYLASEQRFTQPPEDHPPGPLGANPGESVK